MTEQAKVAGYDALVKVNTGTILSPVYTTVAAQDDAKLSMTGSSVDTTSKDGEGWESNLAGLLKWSLDFGSFFVPTDEGFSLLANAFKKRQQVMVQVAVPGVVEVTYTGTATITDMSLDLSMKNAAKNSLKLDGSGPLLDNNITVTAPTITAPVANATGVSATASCITSAFATSTANSDTHASTQWQITLDTDTVFASPVLDTYSPVEKTTLLVATSILTAATTYRIRVRHCGAKYGWSTWSTPHSFTVAS